MLVEPGPDEVILPQAPVEATVHAPVHAPVHAMSRARRDAIAGGGLVAALLLFAVLLPVLGYVVSSAALFVAAALLLGAPRGWTVVAYGWALAAVVFLVFDRLIGLTLPAGPWGF